VVGIAPTILFVIDGVVELIVLAAACFFLGKQVFSRRAGHEKEHGR